MTEARTNGFCSIIGSNESLQLVLEKMVEFDKRFCEFIIKGSEFTIRLEVRGNLGEIIYVRVNADDLAKPKGSQGRINKKANSTIAS